MVILPVAQSDNISKVESISSGSSVDTWSLYTVSLKEVCALISAPKRAPFVSKKCTRSFFGKFSVPLKAICSRKRSEERRVGKECRCEWWRERETTNKSDNEEV